MKWKVGDVRAVPVRQGWGLARVVGPGNVEFYSGPVVDLECLTDLAGELRSQEPKYVLAVMDSALRSKNWPVLGNVPASELLMPTRKENWKFDRVSAQLSITWRDWKNNERGERPASFDECVGLERASVWHAEHVETRLSDEFDGLPSSVPGTALDPRWRTN